jgi:hypothetical protein
MGAVTFRCPTTGRDFSTGIYIDEDGLKKLTNTVTKAACPALWRNSQLVDQRGASVGACYDRGVTGVGVFRPVLSRASLVPSPD